MFGLMILFVFSDDSDDDKTHTVDLLVDTLKETAALLLLAERGKSLSQRRNSVVKCPKCFIDLPISVPMFWSS